MVETLYFVTLAIGISVWFRIATDPSRVYEAIFLFVIAVMISFQFYRSMELLSQSCIASAAMIYIGLASAAFVVSIAVFQRTPLGTLTTAGSYSEPFPLAPLFIVLVVSILGMVAMARLAGGFLTFFTAQGAPMLEWSGPAVIADFFVQQIFILLPYLIYHRYSQAQKHVIVTFGIALGVLLAACYSVLLVRRAMMFYSLLYFTMWRQMQGANPIPKSLWIVLCLAATIGLSVVGEVRRVVIQGYKLDVGSILANVVSKDKTTDVLNGVIAVDAVIDGGANLTFASEIIKKAVADYVPKELFPEKKQFIADDTHFWNQCTGVVPPPNEFFTAFATLFRSVSWVALLAFAIIPGMLCLLRPRQRLLNCPTDPLFINVLNGASIAVLYSHEYFISRLIGMFAVHIFIGLPIWRNIKRVGPRSAIGSSRLSSRAAVGRIGHRGL